MAVVGAVVIIEMFLEGEELTSIVFLYSEKIYAAHLAVCDFNRTSSRLNILVRS